MATRFTRTFAVLVSLVAVALLGWLIGRRSPAGGQTTPTPGPAPAATATPAVPATPTPTPVPTAKTWNIRMGDDPCELTDDDDSNAKAPLQVVQKGKHSIKWHTKGGQKMYVILYSAQCDQPPFANAKPLGSSGGRFMYSIGDASKNKIDSGIAAPDACVSDVNDQKTWIKYDQFIQTPHGVFRYCDGWIIIRP